MSSIGLWASFNCRHFSGLSCQPRCIAPACRARVDRVARRQPPSVVRSSVRDDVDSKRAPSTSHRRDTRRRDRTLRAMKLCRGARARCGPGSTARGSSHAPAKPSRFPNTILPHLVAELRRAPIATPRSRRPGGSTSSLPKPRNVNQPGPFVTVSSAGVVIRARDDAEVSHAFSIHIVDRARFCRTDRTRPVSCRACTFRASRSAPHRTARLQPQGAANAGPVGVRRSPASRPLPPLRPSKTAP